MNRSEAEKIAAKFQQASDMMKNCRWSFGLYPTEDNVLWMKDEALSRCHDVECLIKEIREIYAGVKA